MRDGSTLLFLALTLLGLTAGPTFGQGRSGAWLMGRLRSQAEREARHARAAHDEKDARTWQAWAALYGELEKNPKAQSLSAITVARSNIDFTAELATRAEQTGAKDAAELYRASKKMWTDLARQLEHGGGITIRLPEKQMLKPIPGLAGTPWQKMAPATSTRAQIDCQAFAERARACERQMNQMMHEGIVNGDESGDFQAVRREECNRAEELYLAHCGRK